MNLHEGGGHLLIAGGLYVRLVPWFPDHTGGTGDWSYFLVQHWHQSSVEWPAAGCDILYIRSGMNRRRAV